MPFIHLAYGANTHHGVLVAQMATQRVAGIGRVRDHAALPHDFRCLTDQSRLWIIRVDSEKLGHGSRLLSGCSFVPGMPYRLALLGQIGQTAQLDHAFSRAVKIRTT